MAIEFHWEVLSAQSAPPTRSGDWSGHSGVAIGGGAFGSNIHHFATWHDATNGVTQVYGPVAAFVFGLPQLAHESARTLPGECIHATRKGSAQFNFFRNGIVTAYDVSHPKRVYLGVCKRGNRMEIQDTSLYGRRLHLVSRARKFTELYYKNALASCPLRVLEPDEEALLERLSSALNVKFEKNYEFDSLHSAIEMILAQKSFTNTQQIARV